MGPLALTCASVLMRIVNNGWVVTSSNQVEAEEQSDISETYEVDAVPLFIWIKVLQRLGA